MSVTIRVDAATAAAIRDITCRVDRPAVWVASEAIIAAARHMPTPVLTPFLGRQRSTERLLFAFDPDTCAIIDGLRVIHTPIGGGAPSRHAITRAALQFMLSTSGIDGAVRSLGEARPPRQVPEAMVS